MSIDLAAWIVIGALSVVLLALTIREDLLKKP